MKMLTDMLIWIGVAMIVGSLLACAIGGLILLADVFIGAFKALGAA